MANTGEERAYCLESLLSEMRRREIALHGAGELLVFGHVLQFGIDPLPECAVRNRAE